MLYQNGIVAELRGKTARVEFLRSGICGGCAGDRGCGLGPILAMFSKTRTHAIEFDVDAIPEPIRTGDAVRIAIAGPELLKVVGLAYLAPLLGMFAGAWLAATVFPEAGDVSAVFGALAGAVCISRLLAATSLATADRYLRTAHLEPAGSVSGR